MSNIASITAFDGASTPVTHTLVADSIQKDAKKLVAKWKESLTSVPDYAQIRASLAKEVLGSGVTRTELTVEVPVMEVAGPANAQGYTAPPKVAYSDKYLIIALRHPRSTVASSRLTRQLALNIAGGIATTVTPVTTGPAAEAFDQLIMPT